jgi:hypothetical protein
MREIVCPPGLAVRHVDVHHVDVMMRADAGGDPESVAVLAFAALVA